MTRDLQKTLVFVVVAFVMTGAALFARYDRSGGPGVFNDQGKKFFDDFDPNACTSLEVIDFDPATASIRPFKVAQKAGKWVIPSHSDYPADAKQRLVDTATGVFGLTKDSIRSDRPDDHEAFGVVDPLDIKATTLRGIGKRVTLKDVTDKVLADFIIGNEVKGHPEQRYVRVPGQKRTYGVNVKVDLSTRFADWIETNLLQLDVARVRKIVIDHKTFQLERRQVSIVPGDVITLEKKDANSAWTIDGVPPGKEPNTETLLALSKALGDLKIAGIRLKPEDLSIELKQASADVKPTSDEAFMSLVRKGFVPTNAGVLSSKGEVQVTTDEGVIYTLRFGEVLIASGNELSAGTEPSKSAKALSKGANTGEETSEGRYLFVTAAFDPAALPPPTSADKEEMPDDPFAYAEGEKKLLGESEAAKAKAAKLQKDRDEAIAEGKKRAKELSDRFSAWYYVTPGDSYRTIVQDRPNLIREKSAKPANPRPGAGGFPPGFDPSSLGQPFAPGR